MSAENRINGTELDPWQKSARVAFMVIASLALSLLPLRASCELRLANAAQTMGEHQTGHPTGHGYGEGKSDLCCASVGGALIHSAIPDLSGGPSVVPLVVFLVPVLIPSGFAVQPLRLAGAPPPSRSYYARSSRILR